MQGVTAVSGLYRQQWIYRWMSNFNYFIISSRTRARTNLCLVPSS